MYPGDIHVSSTFIVESPRPIDDRTVQATIAARDAIILDKRYNLMRVDVLDNGTGVPGSYQLVLGTDPTDPDNIMNNLNWTNAGGGGTSPWLTTTGGIHYSVGSVGINTTQLDFKLTLEGTFGILGTFETTNANHYPLVRNQTTGEVTQSKPLVTYNATRDAFQLAETADGQVQDLGQEIFVIGYNIDTEATELDPKVFLMVGTNEEAQHSNLFVKPVASDFSAGATLGINTTAFLASGYGKVTSYGHINGVNTSAWVLNAELYLSSTIKGEMTHIKPTINAIAVARVLKVHATEGILFVNTLAGLKIDAEVSPVGISRFYLSGDEITTDLGTFYLATLDSWGTTPEAIGTVTVNDNETEPLPQDHLSEIFVEQLVITEGVRDGLIELLVSSAGALEKVYMEIYSADVDGNPINVPISEAPIGTLGVKPLFVYETTLLDLDANDIFKEELKGLATEGLSVPAGGRLRLRILCSKVGTQAGNKTFSIYFGAEHNTYINTYKDLGTAVDNQVNLYAPITATIAAGGIVVGDTFADADMTVRTLWEALIAPYVKPILTGLVVYPNAIVLVGAHITIDSARLTWSTGSNLDNPTDASVNGLGFGAVVLTTSPQTVPSAPGISIAKYTNSSESWTFTGKDKDGNALSQRSASIYWQFSWHFGASSVIVNNDTSAQSVLSGLQQITLRSGKANSNTECDTYNADAANFTYIAYAAKFGDLSSILQDNVLNVITAFDLLGDFNFTNSAGHSELYRVYKTGSPGAFSADNFLNIS